jgi:TFIIF-interacting CTD phosphatase-like protein
LYIKDLKILEQGRDLADIVIVDNNIQSFYLQLSNGIPIYDYEGDKNDCLLVSLTAYLKQFLKIPDGRTKINADF